MSEDQESKKRKVMSHPKYSSACAACKYIHRKCTSECVFAPYFPATEPKKFEAVLTVYGFRIMEKFLKDLPVEQRADAVSSFVYEAQYRIYDPINGCVGRISELQQQLQQIKDNLHGARKDLSKYTGKRVALPLSNEQFQNMAQEAQQYYQQQQMQRMLARQNVAPEGGAAMPEMVRDLYLRAHQQQGDDYLEDERFEQYLEAHQQQRQYPEGQKQQQRPYLKGQSSSGASRMERLKRGTVYDVDQKQIQRGDSGGFDLSRLNQMNSSGIVMHDFLGLGSGSRDYLQSAQQQKRPRLQEHQQLNQMNRSGNVMKDYLALADYQHSQLQKQQQGDQKHQKVIRHWDLELHDGQEHQHSQYQQQQPNVREHLQHLLYQRLKQIRQEHQPSQYLQQQPNVQEHLHHLLYQCLKQIGQEHQHSQYQQQQPNDQEHLHQNLQYQPLQQSGQEHQHSQHRSAHPRELQLLPNSMPNQEQAQQPQPLQAIPPTKKEQQQRDESEDEHSTGGSSC